MRCLLIAAALMLATPAAAQTVKPQLSAALPNAPGKTMTVVTVNYAPGQKSGPHHHAGSAFLYARVLAGQVRSEVEGQGPAKVYGVGEGWTEGPNAHHVVSENASATEPASILVVFVADDGATLTTPDKR
ncbi:MAG: cupin domain-containing protein [Phenylobacterium sp.]